MRLVVVLQEMTGVVQVRRSNTCEAGGCRLVEFLERVGRQAPLLLLTYLSSKISLEKSSPILCFKELGKVS